MPAYQTHTTQHHAPSPPHRPRSIHGQHPSDLAHRDLVPSSYPPCQAISSMLNCERTIVTRRINRSGGDFHSFARFRLWRFWVFLQAIVYERAVVRIINIRQLPRKLSVRSRTKPHIILTVRQPSDRLYSMYQYTKYHQRTIEFVADFPAFNIDRLEKNSAIQQI